MDFNNIYLLSLIGGVVFVIGLMMYNKMKKQEVDNKTYGKFLGLYFVVSVFVFYIKDNVNVDGAQTGGYLHNANIQTGIPQF
jgi:hypothetical protein